MTATRRPTKATKSTNSTESTKLERGLQTVVRRHERARQALKQAESERDEAIRAALAAKLPLARVVTVTQLSPQRIAQIRRGDRP